MQYSTIAFKASGKTKDSMWTCVRAYDTEGSSRVKPKWITDFVIMPQFTKFIVGTGDREIQFFELSSFEPYCQISGLETVPLKLDYCSTGHDESLILFGDSQGAVNILVITSTGECLRTWKKATKVDGFIASVSLNDAVGPNVNFIRWAVYGDWVQQLKYYHDIDCTTGSTHVEAQLKEIKDVGQKENREPGTHVQERARQNKYTYGLMKQRLETDQSVFKVYKGVKYFNFSKDKNIIDFLSQVDRVVRLWNPYVPGKPTAMLRGHSAPIFFLFVWDIQDHMCLLTIRPKSHKIRGDLQAVHYSNISKTVAVATDQMAALNLRLKPSLNADIVLTHKEPVTGCLYNPSFKQVITCSESSTIKIWDFETGTAIFEYGEAHGDSAITCMTFDKCERRLITGCRDGYEKTLEEIRNLRKRRLLANKVNYGIKDIPVPQQPKKVEFPNPDEENEEICDLTYVEMNRNKYIVGVGWDRRINIYSDDVNDSNIHHVQHPLPNWHDDVNRGHKEDILSVAQCPPNLLATASYDGKIIVWNMVSGHIFANLMAPKPSDYVDQSFLFTGDSLGFVYLWDIDGYAATHVESEPPEVTMTWRGHVKSVTAISLVEEHKLLITASVDCTVRLWNMDGHYVGTFGQPDPWDIYNQGTWQHPMVPYDVLIDPMSLPDHPVVSEKQNMHQIIYEDKSSTDKTTRTPTPPVVYSKQQYHIDDDTIASLIREKTFKKGTGKRQRHEKLRPVRIDRGGPSEYQMLRTLDLEDTPRPKTPTLKLDKNDPFNFNFID
ncbi:WDR49-like protein [Mya arenaria]|uniref:WDR49-like protein n=1 Tax=Mya arenaria TaxID=6604 RepID=A0ABY7DP36_MYAAR|nr:WDR49-like protein [Mya arenaria]